MLLRPPARLACLLAVAAVYAPPAQAAFFFEGLRPLAERHCLVPAERGLDDPVVAAPRLETYPEGSPRAETRPGVPRFVAPECPQGRPGKLTQPVPQK